MRKAMLLGLFTLIGCQSNVDELLEVREPSTKEGRIIKQVNNFMSNDYTIVGYKIYDKGYGNDMVEITLKDIGGGRTMRIEIEWKSGYFW